MNITSFLIQPEMIRGISRTRGVTALIRYSNDRHTLLPCLESIRGVFDEIVIVHQPCDDGSELLLESIAAGEIPSLADENISVHSYPFFVFPPHYEGPDAIPPINSLANYCNYGLSRITTSHFIKVDTDQIYLNAHLKEAIRSGMDQGVNFSLFGVNVFFDDRGKAIVSRESVFNGLGGDTKLMAFSNDPFFRHRREYEVLHSAPLNHRRFPKPAWLHVTQIRRPQRLRTARDLVPLEHVMAEEILSSVNGIEGIRAEVEAARAAVASSHDTSPFLPGVDELLVVGNSPHGPEELGDQIDEHPFVVRFGEGGIPAKLETNRRFVGTKTDLYCLNGWIRHPAEHLVGKKVMFTRPFECAVNLSHGLFVSRSNRDHILQFASDISFIPRLTFHRFIQEFQYGNPTSGLIFIYHALRVLGKKVKLVNFRYEKGLPSFHSPGANRSASHQVDREREILDHLLHNDALLLR